MALTPQELLTVLSAKSVGTVEGVRHRALRRMTPQERQLIDDVRANLQAARAAWSDAEAPAPPWGKLLPHSPRREPLTASDLMWLDRLPRDPAEVTEDQAKELAQLASRVEPRSSDARLVSSIFEPVRERYQSRTTEALVSRQQKLAPPPPPGYGLTLLAEAIARSEAPAGVGEESAMAFGRARAKEQLDEALARRDAEQGARLASIEARGVA